MSFIKIINYFFFRPLNNVLILIFNNFKGKYFAIFFNMYSFFSLNFIYLSFENNFLNLNINQDIGILHTDLELGFI